MLHRRPGHLRPAASTSSTCGAASGWCSRSRTRFPKSIFDNVAYGLRINGLREAAELPERVEKSLRGAALWDEVKDRLHDLGARRSPAASSSGCASRARSPSSRRSLLMDEPASALDPIATQQIEELIYELKRDYTIVIVTHNMQQAARVSEYTAFFMLGRLVEYDRTDKIFTNPGPEDHGGLHHRPVRLGRRRSAMKTSTVPRQSPTPPARPRAGGHEAHRADRGRRGHRLHDPLEPHARRSGTRSSTTCRGSPRSRRCRRSRSTS